MLAQVESGKNKKNELLPHNQWHMGNFVAQK
jgi:hypothetical protein